MDDDFTAFSFTEAQKTSLRYYMGYDAYGAGNSGFQSYRFFTEYGMMEYRLNNLSLTDGARVVSIHLSQLSGAEQDIFAARANLQAAAAGPYTHNVAEMAQRRAEFSALRMELCQFLGIPPGPRLSGQPARWVM